MIHRIICGDSIEVLRTLGDESVHCCVTSPPYFGLRSYKSGSKEIGKENSPNEYVKNLAQVFREVKRVLRADGVFFLNIGDSYAKFPELKIKEKDVIGIPWMVAFALRDDGWYLRQELIWAKSITMKQEKNFGSCLPESTRDRFCKSHETVFLLTKNKKYYFNQKAVAVAVSDSSIGRYAQDIQAQDGSGRIEDKTNGKMKAVLKAWGGDENGEYNGKNIKGNRNGVQDSSAVKKRILSNAKEKGELLANRRSVWYVGKSLFKENHFAVMPEELAEICIKAGSRAGGTVLDPFAGAGTTLVSAKRLGRNSIGIELNPDYVKIAEVRLGGTR